MNNKFLRRTAVALSISAFAMSSAAHADQYYSSPSRWNNFRPALDEALLADDLGQSGAESAAHDALGSVQELPAPRPQQQSQPQAQPTPTPTPAPQRMVTPGSTHSMSNGSPHYSGGYQNNNYGTSNYSTMPTPATPLPSASYESYPSHSAAPMASAPMASAPMQSYPAQSYPAQSIPAATSDCNSCGSGAAQSSPYAAAMSSPWDSSASCGTGTYGGGSFAGGRPDLFPWFGGGSLLFMSLQDNNARYVATGLGDDFDTSLVDPGTSVGFETTLGRYFGCGKYGFGITYFNWNPGSETITRTGTIQTIRAAMPEYHGVSIDLGNGGGVGTIYDHIDGSHDTNGDADLTNDGAIGTRITRNVFFQGLDASVYGFGLMGAQRAAYSDCGGGSGHGLGRGAGFGGATGPLVRSSSGRLRVTGSSGFRWFQIKDELELAYNIDGGVGYQDEDMYDRITTENNLFGYQMGGFLTYCLGSRLNLNAGGKFGVYGNRAEVQHRLGTETRLAYINGDNTQTIDSNSSTTALSTLGEFDLGLGCRVTRGWTVNGGYRVMGITGVANAVQSYPNNYASVASSSKVYADDSYLLHGAYVGATFNW